MNDDHRATVAPAIAGVAAASRRRLLALLATLPGALGIAAFAGIDATAKKRRKKKRKNKRKGNEGGGGYSPDKEERACLDLINDYRGKNGAGKLSLDNRLGAAAKHHSRDMAKKDYFSHKLSNGDTAEENIRSHGYTNYAVVGENIAAGHETASKVFAAWKKSAEHDKNMRDKQYTEIGIGRAHGKKSKYGWYWTTTFGGR